MGQVAWSAKRGLPWFRVVNREGRISLPSGGGMEEQRAFLENEGVLFGLDGRIELTRFQWTGPERTGPDAGAPQAPLHDPE